MPDIPGKLPDIKFRYTKRNAVNETKAKCYEIWPAQAVPFNENSYYSIFPDHATR
jgi:hypothetical protein